MSVNQHHQNHRIPFGPRKGNWVDANDEQEQKHKKQKLWSRQKDSYDHENDQNFVPHSNVKHYQQINLLSRFANMFKKNIQLFYSHF